MKARSLFLASAIALVLPFTAMADERPDHYKGKQSSTLVDAVANFSAHNSKLAAIVGKDSLSAEDLNQVHELTYTLENALAKISADLAALADTLEAVHVASEQADATTVKAQGRAYLDTARKVVK